MRLKPLTMLFLFSYKSQDLQEFRFTDERSATSQIVSKGTR